MSNDVYIAFILISIAVLVFPGPSILLIVANSIQRGWIAGLYTVVGGFAAMCIQILVATAGLASLESFFEEGFQYLRFPGVVYLLYLGVQRWRGRAHGNLRGRTSRNFSSNVTEGFVVALTNPGTMLFFVAFFPQFMNDDVPAGAQLILMTITFLVLTLIVDTCYALVSARLGINLQRFISSALLDQVAGAILLIAAVTLALVNY